MNVESHGNTICILLPLKLISPSPRCNVRPLLLKANGPLVDLLTSYRVELNGIDRVDEREQTEIEMHWWAVHWRVYHFLC